MIPYGKHYLDDEDIRSVVEVLKNGPLTQGPMVDALEKAVAEYVGVKYAVAVSSGTAALHLSYLAAEVRPGSAIVTSPITFVATANAALYCGGDVIFADIEPESLNMSPKSLRAALSENSNVRAVVPVHFAGLPCNMDLIKELADEAGAVVIEDAAHALGATYSNGMRVGCCAKSLMTIFSFHPVKAIAAGEGGMITTNDEAVYRRLLRLRSHGINKGGDLFELEEQATTNGIINPWYYEMQEQGYHYRISDIQCALALSQLKKLDNFISRRRELAYQYDRELQSNIFCELTQSVGRNFSGHHLYVLRINFSLLKVSRAEFMTRLRSLGIITQVHYLPVIMHPYYRRLGFEPRNYANSLKYYEEALSIPIYYSLTDNEQAYVLDGLNLK